MTVRVMMCLTHEQRHEVTLVPMEWRRWAKVRGRELIVINAFTKMANVSVMTVHPSQRNHRQSTLAANEGLYNIPPFCFLIRFFAMVEHRFFDDDSVDVRNVAAGWNARPHQLCTEGISGIRKIHTLDFSLARKKQPRQMICSPVFFPAWISIIIRPYVK